jgi:hypothetical protein
MPEYSGIIARDIPRCWDVSPDAYGPSLHSWQSLAKHVGWGHVHYERFSTT